MPDESTQKASEYDGSTELLATALSSISDFAYVFDRDGRFLYVNHALLSLWGLTLEQAVGKNFFDLAYPADLAATLQRQIQQVIDTGEGLTDETPYESPTGAGGYFEYIFRPVFATDGSVKMVAGSTRDISARKLAESQRDETLRQLAAERERLRNLFLQAPAAICMLGGPDHRFELVNPHYLRLVARSAEELLGRTVIEALPEVTTQGFVELLDGVYATGKPFVGRELALRIRRADGEWEDTIVNFVYQPSFDSRGQIDGILVHVTDVTDLVRAREREADANRMKDDFVATVSHELRTPLNAILGWATVIRGTATDADAVCRGLETIERNARAQAQIIEDLLDLSRITTGKLRLDVRPVDLNAIAIAVADSLRPAIDAKEIRLHLMLEPSVVEVSGDPDRLQQVVWNLLSNAVKFTSKGGEVRIRLERVDSHIELSVSDTGRGIAAEFLSKVFEQFRQADSSTSRVHTGLGLGLAIVKRIVELHGGVVRAESEGVGRGATFTVVLPVLAVRAPSPVRVQQASRGEAVELDAAPDLSGVRVLGVDDEPDARELLAVLLLAHGAEVRIAGSAAEALDMLDQWMPDVIVSDIGMPRVDGYSFIRSLRARPVERGGRVPAAALTAYARAEDRMRALNAGFQLHLPKPIEAAELLTVVAVLADRGSVS